MNEVKIHFKRVGYSNIALLKSEGIVLVDTGFAGQVIHIENWLDRIGVRLDGIRLIILTHVHHDHTGNLNEVASKSGAPVMVHKNEFENLRKGFIRIPRGQGPYSSFISGVGRIIAPRFASPKPFTAELVNNDEFSLSGFGIDGKVISTPGHTSGSQSVLVGKKLITGDTFLNLSNGIFFPHFADNPEILLETWQKLFNLDIEEIYPGHGKPFRVEKAYPEFEKWKKKFKMA
jgi:glyoxylase-like metal-dependent hydrolase (beta-lactamase superfamily II)